MCSARRKPLKVTRETSKMPLEMPENAAQCCDAQLVLLPSTAPYLLPLHSTLNHILCCFSCMSIAKMLFF
jgi:hypothetical protein